MTDTGNLSDKEPRKISPGPMTFSGPKVKDIVVGLTGFGWTLVPSTTSKRHQDKGRYIEGFETFLTKATFDENNVGNFEFQANVLSPSKPKYEEEVVNYRVNMAVLLLPEEMEPKISSPVQSVSGSICQDDWKKAFWCSTHGLK